MHRSCPPKEVRAQGMPGVLRTRGLVSVKKAHEVITTGSPNSPAFPARWFSGLFRALLGVPGLIATVTPEKQFASHELNASVGASGPHDFAVRVRALRHARCSRPSRPAFNVRDDRDTPLM